MINVVGRRVPNVAEQKIIQIKSRDHVMEEENVSNVLIETIGIKVIISNIYFHLKLISIKLKKFPIYN